MVSRNRGGFSTEEERASSSASSISDMLIFITMCIIGHDVDIYVKDGSIYSRIFYTSSFRNEYAIVLKKAKLTKKGNLVANVANMDVIETLIIKSQDLVQVVSKGVRDSANGCAGNASTCDIGATNNAASSRCVEKGSQVTNNRKHHGNKKRIVNTMYHFFSFYYYNQCVCVCVLIVHFLYCFVVIADERDDISHLDSEKFNSIINEVENLHQLDANKEWKIPHIAGQWFINLLLWFQLVWCSWSWS